MKNIEELIEDTKAKVEEAGDGTVNISAADLKRLTNSAESHIDLVEKIVLHQEEPESDLLTIGELVLSELGLWG